MTIICVISSSLRCCESCFTDGRTAGGGIASVWQTIHSGRDQIGLNPINETLSSDILRNNLITFSGVSLIEIFEVSSLPSLVSISSHSAISVARFSFLILLGCLHPQPSSVASPQRLILLACWNTWFHRSSGFKSKNSLYLSLLINNLLHLIQQHLNILIIVGKYCI